jgi:rhodanese-related sulfurtransferase
MSLREITPLEAKQLVDNGAMLVDIRDPDEHAREHIPQARLRPVSSLQRGKLDAGSASQVVFHCRSGNRTISHAGSLAAATDCDAYILQGGLEAWKRAGLPVKADSSQPLELMRQVQITAGGAVVLGVALGALVSPWFYLLPGLVGAGLVFAGATGFCGLARLLQAMPWNRRPVT